MRIVIEADEGTSVTTLRTGTADAPAAAMDAGPPAAALFQSASGSSAGMGAPAGMAAAGDFDAGAPSAELLMALQGRAGASAPGSAVDAGSAPLH